MYSRSFCLAIMMVAAVAADAQQVMKERSGGIVGLGVGFGYDNVRGNPGIQGQFVMSGLADVTLGPGTFVSCRVGFSKSARQYFRSVNSTLENLYWKNLSVTSAVFRRVSGVGSLGLGAGIDWIDFSGDNVVYPRGSVVGSDGNVTGPPTKRSSLDWKSVAPSLTGLANIEFVMPQGARIVILCYMKFSYVGHPRGGENYFLVQTTGISVAFMRDMVR